MIQQCKSNFQRKVDLFINGWVSELLGCKYICISMQHDSSLLAMLESRWQQIHKQLHREIELGCFMRIETKNYFKDFLKDSFQHRWQLESSWRNITLMSRKVWKPFFRKTSLFAKKRFCEKRPTVQSIHLKVKGEKSMSAETNLDQHEEASWILI